MSLTLHHSPGSRSFRVLWMLEELGEAFDIVPYSFTDAGLRSPEHLARSPAGKVPALEIDGTVWFESLAILQLLAERAGRLLPPPGDAERADALAWLMFAETQAICLQNLNIQHNFIRPAEARSVPTIKLETRRLALTAKALSARLAGRETVLDSGFSAVDCALGFNVPALFHFLRRDEWPVLSAYWDRMAARPACARARDRDGGRLLEHDFYEVPDA